MIASKYYFIPKPDPSRYKYVYGDGQWVLLFNNSAIATAKTKRALIPVKLAHEQERKRLIETPWNTTKGKK